MTISHRMNRMLRSPIFFTKKYPSSFQSPNLKHTLHNQYISNTSEVRIAMLRIFTQSAIFNLKRDFQGAFLTETSYFVFE